MKTNFLKLSIILAMFLCLNDVYASNRIFWLDSYHPGYAWTDALGEAITGRLQGSDVELKVFHMDTKRNKSKSYVTRIAEDAVNEIKAFKPQVVIASDDAASKYVVMPYFKNASLPFVFCGINHSADRYGYPYRNVTGILEMDPVDKLIFVMSRFGPVGRVGYLSEDGTTGRVNGAFYKTQLRAECSAYYVGTFQEWQNVFRRAQKEVDVLIIGNTSAIQNWNDNKAKEFVMRETKILTGTVYDFLADLAFISCIKMPEEQGNWAAKTALDIINGASIDSIPIATPKSFKLFLNMKIADVLGKKFPRSYLKKADKIIK